MCFAAGHTGTTTTFPLLLAAILALPGISALTGVSSTPCQDKLSSVYSSLFELPHGLPLSLHQTPHILSDGRMSLQDCLTSLLPSDGSNYPDCTLSLLSNAVLELGVVTDFLNEMKEIYVSIMNQNIRFPFSLCC